MLLQSSFSPTPILRNANIQTVLGGLGGRYLSLPPAVRTKMTANDGDVFFTDEWNQGAATTLILLPGLEGSPRSGYLRRLVRFLLATTSCGIMVVYSRGCTGIPNNQLRSYHSGFTEDLTQLIAERNMSSLILIGFSIGGNIVLKCLGELEGRAPHVRGAVAISTPCDLGRAAIAITRRPTYQRYFINSFQRKHQRKVRAGIAPADYAIFQGITTFWDYDNRFTAPLFGYDSPEAYWEHNSSRHYLARITVPTHLIIAEDDPFFCPLCIPRMECDTLPLVSLEVPQFGGHVGFLSSFTSQPYVDHLILRKVEEFQRGSSPKEAADTGLLQSRSPAGPSESETAPSHLPEPSSVSSQAGKHS
jgi:predicted alpha/beta-fold hydrolase